MENLLPKRELNLLQTAAVIIGAVIGSGVFMNIPIIADITGSPLLSILIWFGGGLLWIPQILILAELGTAYPNQGGPYYFIYKAGSPFLAFQYTWTAFLTSDTPTLTIIGLVAASAISHFFPVMENPLYAKIFASFLILFFAFVQCRSVKTGGNLQVVLTISKLLPLFAIVGFGLFYLNSGNLSSGIVVAEKNDRTLFAIINAGIAATLWAYAGFVNILYMAGEVKNPHRNLPTALIGSIIFVMLAYILITLCTSAIVPFDRLIAAKGGIINPFEYLSIFSGAAGGIFAVAVFVSMLGVLNAVIMAQPRLEYATARDGLFFEVFGKLHPKYLTPHYSIFIQSGLAILLFTLGEIEDMLGYFTISYALQNGLIYGSIFFLRKKEEYKPTYKLKLWRFWGGLAILIQLYFSFGTFMAFPTGGIIASLGLILLGTPVYLYYYRKKTSRL